MAHNPPQTSSQTLTHSVLDLLLSNISRHSGVSSGDAGLHQSRKPFLSAEDLQWLTASSPSSKVLNQVLFTNLFFTSEKHCPRITTKTFSHCSVHAFRSSWQIISSVWCSSSLPGAGTAMFVAALGGNRWFCKDLFIALLHECHPHVSAMLHTCSISNDFCGADTSQPAMPPNRHAMEHHHAWLIHLGFIRRSGTPQCQGTSYH